MICLALQCRVGRESLDSRIPGLARLLLVMDHEPEPGLDLVIYSESEPDVV